MDHISPRTAEFRAEEFTHSRGNFLLPQNFAEFF